MISLVLLRALRKTRRFWLASNHSGAGDFDDVVLLWKNADEENLSCCLVQLKHKATFVLNKCALLSTAKKKDGFSVLKYFKSFVKICDYWRQGILPIQVLTYALYTNAPLNAGLQLVASDVPHLLREILGTGNGSVASPRGITEVEALLGESGDCERVKEFLENFTVWYGQAGPDELRRCLKEELRVLLALPPEREEAAAEMLENTVKKWWIADTDCHYLTESTVIWREFVFRRVEEVNCNRPGSPIYKVPLTFNRGKLRLDGQVTVVVAETELSVLKVTQALGGRDAVLVVAKITPEVLTLWSGLWCNSLVVVGDSELLGAEDILIKDPRKRLVNVVRNNPSYSKWTVLKDSCSLEDLYEQSRKKLLSTKVSFQGYETEFRSLFKDEKEATNVLTAEHLFLLATATTAVTVGAEVDSDLPSDYMSRVISRRHLIQKDFFLSVRDCGDICAVIGISDTHLRFWLGRTEANVHDFRSAMEKDAVDFVVLPSREYFEDIVARFCGRRDAHLLQYEDGEWHWLQTNGSMTKVRQHLLNESAVVEEVGDRCAVIVGSPGIGKSALLAKMAAEVKGRNSHIWVLRVNLASYTRLLAETGQDFDALHLLEEFAKLGDSDSLARAILRHCLQVSGHLDIMLDGVDEVSPNYTAQCVSLVNELLRTTKVRRILLASRPAPRRLLEDSLCTLAYDIEPLNQKQQEELLGTGVAAAISTANLGDLLGIPLFVNMLSQVTIEYLFIL